MSNSLTLTPAQAARAFLTPRRPGIVRPLDLPDGERLRLPTAEAELAAVAAGDGPTVLIVHGWEGQASDLGAIAVALLAAGHRIVAVDLPAHGQSAGRTTSPPPTESPASTASGAPACSTTAARSSARSRQPFSG